MKSKDLLDELDKTRLPRHIAFIMDGNGRWATKRLLPRKMGHKEGVKTMRAVISDCVRIGIEVVSLFAFSTENKSRPKDEIDALMQLIRDNIYDMLKDLIAEGVKVTFMGDLSYFSDDIRESLDRVLRESAGGTKAVVNIGLNYGSRDEIVQAVNKCVQERKTVSAEEFKQYLYTKNLPDPDLIVRTSGEFRLSNFMLYQAAYSEVVVTKTLWPDFDNKALVSVLKEYAQRNRRYGKI
ncbi:MAG: di-trans,poly-cis-decaprenylcistransferase [Clostridia bacterium]|nr:di-trans,poly-cis-decaprenylcistransferase [Clostridia bacterium]